MAPEHEKPPSYARQVRIYHSGFFGSGTYRTLPLRPRFRRGAAVEPATALGSQDDSAALTSDKSTSSAVEGTSADHKHKYSTGPNQPLDFVRPERVDEQCSKNRCSAERRSSDSSSSDEDLHRILRKVKIAKQLSPEDAVERALHISASSTSDEGDVIDDSCLDWNRSSDTNSELTVPEFGVVNSDRRVQTESKKCGETHVGSVCKSENRQLDVQVENIRPTLYGPGPYATKQAFKRSETAGNSHQRQNDSDAELWQNHVVEHGLNRHGTGDLDIEPEHSLTFARKRFPIDGSACESVD